MSAARTFVRLAVAGFLVNALAIACVVDSSTDSVSCNPGDKKDCSCSDGSTSLKTCNSKGNGYNACACQTGAGGNGSGGEGTTTAGTATTGGSISYAGQNTGGEPVTGTGGIADTGGAGAGAGGAPTDTTPLECQDPSNDCETCYFGGCCEQYAPCVNDPDNKCLTELADVLACTDAIRADRNVKTSDLESCAQQVGSTQGSWSASLSPLTVNVVNCIAGEAGWEGKPWGQLACKASCFDK